MDLQNTVKNLEKNRMRVIVLEHKEDVVDTLRGLMTEGATVTHGGSVTLSECGVPALLEEHYTYLDRSKAENVRDVYLAGYDADYFLTSANAITETGCLYNVDGNSNRVSMIAFGPKKVIVIAGINKIVPDLAAAVQRVKSIAAPKNAMRLGCKTYCAANGKCVSLLQENPEMCDGCDSPARICCNYLVSAAQRDAERVTVILIKENLGL